MKFWQAVIISQMAAGAVYADRFSPGTFAQHITDAGNIVLGGVAWFAARKLSKWMEPTA